MVKIDKSHRYFSERDRILPTNFCSTGNIPVVFFFNGTHEDYHMTTDTVEKINFEKMEKIGQHVFHLAWEIANRAEKPQLK
mgnify:CR=1 FL=1